MSAEHPDADRKKVSPADFPALRNFLRGYFHQDMKDEYGSPVEAVRKFCADASADERAAVAAEWSRFLAQMKGQSLDAVNRTLTHPLGSSYALTAEDVTTMSSLLAQPSNPPRK